MPVDVTDNLGMPVGLLYKRIDSQGETNALQEEIKRLKNELQA
jgi:hypothetical protein